MAGKIKIAPNGPYLVSGVDNLIEETSRVKDRILQALETGTYEHDENYALCRCGESANKPFCDGTHRKNGFDGTETASRKAYLDRAYVQEGPGMDLLDDDRCAYARFCHRQKGDVWELTDDSQDAESKREAIEGACACPTGRLTAVVDGKLVEETYEPTIAIAQDPMERVSAGIYVRGDIELEAADGTVYEQRNRVSLCRCGASMNKPFCDASHVEIDFSDKE